MAPLSRPGAREAFLQTLRAVIDVHGQRVNANDRLHLLEHMPTLIVWGERDGTIPVAHGRDAHSLAPGSHFETIPGAAHFPHVEKPDELVAILRRWMDDAPAVHIADSDWGRIVARETAARV